MKKKQIDSKGAHGAVTPARVSPRLEGVVKNRGTKAVRKGKKR